MLVLAAAAFAAGARAQAQAPASNAQPTVSADDVAAQKKATRNKAWENGVKTDCAAEIATGGVCAGKDFDTGLEKCLHANRKKLSDGCRVTLHPHRKGAKGKKDAAPAATPAQ
jgi:hypothetical protein